MPLPKTWSGERQRTQRPDFGNSLASGFDNHRGKLSSDYGQLAKDSGRSNRLDRLRRSPDEIGRRNRTGRYASSNIRGLYNPLHFVVRLNPDLHDILESKPSGFFKPGEVDISHWDAFSTYLHETIHWWQHIGSTTGLMLSLSYPAESHVNRDHLLAILNDNGCKKSLKTLLELDRGQLTDETARRLNIVLNNWHDGEFNRQLILDPRRLDDITKSPYFDSVGHSLEMGLSHSLWLLKGGV